MVLIVGPFCLADPELLVRARRCRAKRPLEIGTRKDQFETGRDVKPLRID
jgi:hypothetical protein